MQLSLEKRISYWRSLVRTESVIRDNPALLRGRCEETRLALRDALEEIERLEGVLLAVDKGGQQSHAHKIRPAGGA